MIEIWKSIPGYEGLYEVSNTGQIRSLDMYVKVGFGAYRLQKGKVLSPAKDKNGYFVVCLTCNGKHKTIKVHRLVAQAFIENPYNLPQINHRDEVKTNNNVDNLEWCDSKYNMNYGTRTIRRRETLIKNESWNGFRCGLSKKEYNQKYYQDNKDKLNDRKRSYYQKNKDRICERQKEYYRKKKEEIQNNV